MLDVVGVHCRFGSVTALAGVTAHFKRGRTYGLVGPSGAGKTALLDVICGLAAVSMGQVRLDGKRIDRMPANRVARSGVVRSFQRVRLLPGLTLVEFLIAAQHGRGASRLIDELCFTRMARTERAQHTARAHALLDRVGLKALADYPAATLTRGELRRLEVARALAQAPDYLLLDAPLAGLDDREANTLDNLLRQVADSGVTIIIAERDVILTSQLCDWLVVLHAGQVIAEGKPSELSANLDVTSAYLGA